MDGKQPLSGSEFDKLIDRQMRRWEMARAQCLEQREVKATKTVQDFVAFSRQVGSSGAEVARLLAERLDWPLFDKEILHVMAGDDRVRERLYEQMDERDVGWMEQTLRWLLEGDFRVEDYFHRLTETVLALAWQGHAVFLGRGVDLILPRDRGLRVRIVALREWRVRRYAERLKLGEALALTQVERIDRERADFIRRYFRKPLDDISRYDLTINAEQFKTTESVDLILAALRMRGVIA